MRKLYLIILGVLTVGAVQLARSNPPMPPPSPQVVAKVVMVGQTGMVPPTIVYTPVAADEVLHVSGYVVYRDPSYGTNNAYIALQWTDELQARTNVSFCAVINGACQGEIVIHPIPGIPIQFSSNNPGVTTPYNLYLTVIKE